MSGTDASFPHPLYEKFVLQPAFKGAQTHYFQPMIAANRAHSVMLHRCGIISAENARALLAGLQSVADAGVEALAYRSGVEDLFFAMERVLIQHAGEAYGGNLQLARSRNDLGYALTRLALRPRILQSVTELLNLRRSLHAFAKAHVRTLMPGYTHTQPAQPTTMAHYFAGVLALLERDSARLRFANATNNQSPLGAAALTGTGFPIDRDMVAALLGFDRVQGSTWDSIGASDNLTDVGGAILSLGVNLSRVMHDMLFWATQESGAIQIHASFLQISSIMPQKRNPVVLEHLRARVSRMMALANGIALQCHNIPFGDTQDIEDAILPPLFGSLDAADEVLQLFRAVMETLDVNVDYLRQRAGAGFTTVTELADTLVRDCDLPFRQAHSIVAALVTEASRGGLEADDLNAEALNAIARQVTGSPIELSQAALERALDPQHFVDSRDLPGGAAPSATADLLDAQLERIEQDERWLHEVRAKLLAAERRLDDEAAAILSGS